MPAPTTVPMDAYRLAQYTVGVPCHICEGNNNFDAELCRHCFAPMALAHQSKNQKAPPQLVATLGTAGAGKTVYLGMLMDMLSHDQDRWHLTARGAFSVSLQQKVAFAMSACGFPAKTPNEAERWNWVHCQARLASQRQSAELIMPDLPGEAILEEIEHPNTYPVVRDFLSKSSAVMILVDGAALESGEKSQDFFTMKMVSYLLEIGNNERGGWGNRPVSLVFTKADQCETCFEDTDRYARMQAPGLWQMCNERLQNYRFFSVGVAGAVADQSTGQGYVQLPLRIEPRGVVEPFEWIMNQLSGR